MDQHHLLFYFGNDTGTLDIVALIEYIKNDTPHIASKGYDKLSSFRHPNTYLNIPKLKAELEKTPDPFINFRQHDGCINIEMLSSALRDNSLHYVYVSSNDIVTLNLELDKLHKTEKQQQAGNDSNHETKEAKETTEETKETTEETKETTECQEIFITFDQLLYASLKDGILQDIPSKPYTGNLSELVSTYKARYPELIKALIQTTRQQPPPTKPNTPKRVHFQDEQPAYFLSPPHPPRMPAFNKHMQVQDAPSPVSPLLSTSTDAPLSSLTSPNPLM